MQNGSGKSESMSELTKYAARASTRWLHRGMPGARGFWRQSITSLPRAVGFHQLHGRRRFESLFTVPWLD